MKKQIYRSSLMVAVCVALLSACANGGVSKSNKGSVPDGYYRVKTGDNLYRIGLRYGQTAATLARWNGLSDPSQIEVGQLLRVKSTRVSDKAKNGSRTKTERAERSVKPLNQLNLIWPVSGGQSNIISRYNGTTNKGIDIGGTLGTPIQAAASGKVLYVGEGVRGYGKLILISHNATTLTAYAHNDSILVTKNQTIRQGQTIARMGRSDSDRVKLHFELRVNGKAVNPSGYLR